MIGRLQQTQLAGLAPRFGAYVYSVVVSILFDWSRLRSHHGSLQKSFERLTSVLAHHSNEFRETLKPGWRFVSNGVPDGGLECFWESPTGEIHGFQAKFFRNALRSVQWQQITKSFDQAIAKYPKLVSWTLCLPQDLPNSPVNGKFSARQRWEAWVKKAETKSGHFISVHLWGDHHFTDELRRHEHIGTLKFFFDANVLAPESLSHHIATQIVLAGTRYQPVLHIANRTEQLIPWLVLDGHHTATLLGHAQATAASVASLKNVRDLEFTSKIGEIQIKIDESFHSLTLSLDSCHRQPISGNIETFCKSVNDLISELYRLDPRYDNAQPSDRAERDKRDNRWRELSPIIDNLHAETANLRDGWEMNWSASSDSRAALITGEGGCGKTHLMCETARRLTERGLPTVLLLGQQLRASKLSTDVLSVVQGFSTVEEFLAALNIAGEVAGCRSLVIIDALNEGEDNQQWNNQLESLLKGAGSFPNVAFLFTVRDAYLEYIRPQSGNERLPEFRLDGFAGTTAEATGKYFDHYNIAAPDVPTLHPEFENPLFLSMFCQAVAGHPDPDHRRAPLPFVGGMTGFSEVFRAFIKRRDTELGARFSWDRDVEDEPLVAALDEVAKEMSRSKSLSITRERAKVILDQHIVSTKGTPNLLGVLESDGILLKVPRSAGKGRMREHVQFAYDRMGSHFIVSHWLGTASTRPAGRKLLQGKALKWVKHDSDWSGRNPSLAEELLIQWSERFKEELFDARPKLIKSRLWTHSFLRALSVANPRAFGETTSKWILAALRMLRSDEELCQVLRQLLARYTNTKVIDTIHQIMMAQSLPARDAWWSIFLAHNQDDAVLVSWPLKREVPPMPNHIACAYCTALAWLTGVSAPILRGNATKAITAILENNLGAGPSLLTRFAAVNDPYILQSVTLALYAACMRSAHNVTGIRTIADSAYDLFFASAKLPVDVLIRHALAGLVELAMHRDLTCSYDMALVLPPYKSRWVTPIPSWKHIDPKTPKDKTKRSGGYERIVSSCRPESHPHMYGDFGRYIVSSDCHPFWDDKLLYGHTPHGKVRPFALDLPHRFIIKRVLELGWTPDRFDSFDAGLWNDRMGSRSLERIGKKYQWIALSEFLARASDRFPLHNSWSEPPIVTYQGPWQFGRHFHTDPSLLRIGERNGESTSTPTPDNDKWAPLSDHALIVKGDGHSWLLKQQGFPDPAQYILQEGSGTIDKVAMLSGFLTWRNGSLAKLDEVSTRIWLHIHAAAIHQADLAPMKHWMKTNKANSWRPHPGLSQISNPLFGELYWSRAARPWDEREADDWYKGDRDFECPVALGSLATQFLNEFDPTFDGSFYAVVPSRWLVEKMKLWPGRDGVEFVDPTGTRVCFNPKKLNTKHDMCFCDFHRVSDALATDGLQMVWIVFGEKNHVRGHRDEGGPVWPWLQGFYWMNKGKLKGWHNVWFDEDFRNGRPRKYPVEIGPGFPRKHGRTTAQGKGRRQP